MWPGENITRASMLAEPERLAVGEQPVPLRAVGLKIGAVVDVLPELLDVDDVRADRGRRAGLLLEIVRGGEMVGVRMGVEDPFDRQALLRDMGEDRIGAAGRDRAGLLVEVEHRIDDRAGLVAGSETTYWTLQVRGS